MDYIDNSYINPMPQLTISKQNFKVTVGNIERVFKSASQERIAETRKWYQNAQDFTKAVANKLNANDLSRFKVSGVISAISPRNEWNKNKLDAENLCKEFVSNKYYQLPLFDADYHTLLKTKVSTFNTNKSKAVKILLNDDSKIESILKGNKIVNFFKCINGDSNAICIDGHAFNIACNRVSALSEVPAISDKHYKMISNVYRDAKNFINKKYNLNLKSMHLQSVTWNEYKRLHNK